jgi:hypothetical protein
MVVLKPKEVEAGLKRKGFIIDSKKKGHRHYVLWVNGKKEGATSLSHNSPEISDDLLSWMAGEIGLTAIQFVEFVKCTLVIEEYLRIRQSELESSLRILPRG